MLFFRGFAARIPLRDAPHRTFWDHGFCYGSAVATLAQGVMLGAFIQGFEVEGRHFAGGAFDFLTPFSLLTGVALVFGYGLLGAGWLVLKTEGGIQARARRHGKLCLVAVLAAILAVSVWTPLMHDVIAQRWFSWPNILLLAPVPAATALAGFGVWRALSAHVAGGRVHRRGLPVRAGVWRHRHQPLADDRAASLHAVAGGLVGAHPGLPADRHLFLLPVIFAYTGWSCWVFRGKVRGDIGYH
jgi:cytochrome d ubiquinol oxidase subunit II